MSEKYSKLYEQTEARYANGSPIVILAAALLMDNTNGNILGQVKYKSISDKPVLYLKARIRAYDPLGALLDDFEQEYLDIFAERNADFGAKQPIFFKNPSTRSFEVEVISLAFADRTVWNSEEGTLWKALPAKKPISALLPEPAQLALYKKNFGNSANYVTCEAEGIWLCTCGAICHAEEQTCPVCGASHEALCSIDPDYYKKEAAYLSALELIKSNTAQNRERAKSLLLGIEGYKDTNQLLAGMEAEDEARRKAEELKAEKRRKTVKTLIKVGIIAAIAIAVIFAVVAIIFAIGTAMSGDGLAYTMLDNGSYEVSGVLDERGIFEIPAEVDGVPVKIIGSEAFARGEFNEVVIPEGIERIEDYAFAYSKIEMVIIPSTVTEIGSSAFYQSSVQYVQIDGAITELKPNTFAECIYLNSVTLPDSLISIGEGAFRGCSCLSSLRLPNDLTFIGERAFFGCSSLASCILPTSLRTISSQAFMDSGISGELVIPSSVTLINKNAFFKCYSISSVHFLSTDNWLVNGVYLSSSEFSDRESIAEILVESGFEFRFSRNAAWT